MSLALEVTNVPYPAVAVMTNAHAVQDGGVCIPISEASRLVSYLLRLLSVTVTVLGCGYSSRFPSCHHHLQEAKPTGGLLPQHLGRGIWDGFEDRVEDS